MPDAAYSTLTTLARSGPQKNRAWRCINYANRDCYEVEPLTTEKGTLRLEFASQPEGPCRLIHGWSLIRHVQSGFTTTGIKH